MMMVFDAWASPAPLTLLVAVLRVLMVMLFFGASASSTAPSIV